MILAAKGLLPRRLLCRVPTTVESVTVTDSSYSEIGDLAGLSLTNMDLGSSSVTYNNQSVTYIPNQPVPSDPNPILHVSEEDAELDFALDEDMSPEVTEELNMNTTEEVHV